jgi:hypothetical protein
MEVIPGGVVKDIGLVEGEPHAGIVEAHVRYARMTFSSSRVAGCESETSVPAVRVKARPGPVFRNVP